MFTPNRYLIEVLDPESCLPQTDISVKNQGEVLPTPKDVGSFHFWSATLTPA